MHIFSNVRAFSRRARRPSTLFRATFPAGTVSGAPKIRPWRSSRNWSPSAGGVRRGRRLFWVFQNMDTCITIRSILIKDGQAYIQVGAGVVADSDPQKEFEETLNKAQAIFQSIRQAEEGLP